MEGNDPYLYVAWFFFPLFIKWVAVGDENEYYSWKSTIKKEGFVKPKRFKFLFKKAKTYTRYIGIPKDRYYNACILFATYCATIPVLLMDIFLGTIYLDDATTVLGVVAIVMAVFYDVPFELILYKKK